MPWAQNHHSEAAAVTFNKGGGAPCQKIPAELSRDAAGVGGAAPQNGLCGTGAEFTSGQHSMMGQTLQERFGPGQVDYRSANAVAAAAMERPGARDVYAANARDAAVVRETSKSSTLMLGDHKMPFQRESDADGDCYRHMRQQGMVKRRQAPADFKAAQQSIDFQRDATATADFRPALKPVCGGGRNHSQVSMDDNAPIDPQKYRAHAGKGTEQTFTFRMDQPLSPGVVATKDGDLVKAYRSPASKRGHSSSVGVDLDWNPSAQSASLQEAHNRRMMSKPRFDPPVEGPRGRAHVRNDASGSKIQDVAMQWNDETAKNFQPDHHRGRGVPPHQRDAVGLLEQGRQAPMPPPPPRHPSEMARTFYEGPTQSQPVADPNGFCGGEAWMETAGLDHKGRGLATSNVDEAVFNKTPMGGWSRQSSVLANFNINNSGEIGGR